MRKLFSKREKVILYLTIAIIVFALCLNFFIAPVLLQSDSLSRAIQLTRAKYKKYSWLLSSKEAIEARAMKYPALGTEAGRQEEASINILSELENIAKAANVKIIDIRPETAFERPKGPYKEVIVSLTAESNMEGYINFIYNLENSLSLLRIKSFALSAKANSQLLEGNFRIAQLSGGEG